LPPEWLGPPADFRGVVWPAGGDNPVPVLRLFAADMRGGAPLPDIGAAVEFTLGARALWPCAFDVVVIESLADGRLVDDFSAHQRRVIRSAGRSPN